MELDARQKEALMLLKPEGATLQPRGTYWIILAPDGAWVFTIGNYLVEEMLDLGLVRWSHGKGTFAVITGEGRKVKTDESEEI